MSSLKLWWQRARGRSCDSCAFADRFVSNGDGQVTRLHTFCQAPASPHQGRPVPELRLCLAWQRRAEPREAPTVGDPNLTA